VNVLAFGRHEGNTAGSNIDPQQAPAGKQALKSTAYTELLAGFYFNNEGEGDWSNPVKRGR
jgi:hypothetical protein